jgi:hypothetical protein
VDGGVFISYRGNDCHSYGALLYLELSRCFGTDLVFLDSRSIPAGTDFAIQLLAQVRQARVVLALIGRSWLTATDAEGRRLIDDPRDWVRRELVEACDAGTLVIPVLADGAKLPTEAQLPDDIAWLSRCQYRQLRHRDLAADLRRLRADLIAADPSLAAALRRRSARVQRRPGVPVRRLVAVRAAGATGGPAGAERPTAPDLEEVGWAGEEILLRFATAGDQATGAAGLRWSWAVGLLALAAALAAAALAIRGRPDRAW